MHIAGEQDPYATFDKPEIEIIDGVAVPKVSPRRRHAVLQAAFVYLLLPWAGTDHVVGTEWRFRLREGTIKPTSLVPDIAVVSTFRLRELSDEDAEEPPFAPDIAIEIRSPSNRERTIATKIERYLQFGGVLVLDVDPISRTIRAYDRDGATAFAPGEMFVHPAMPQLRFDTADFFSKGELGRPPRDPKPAR